jgi:hypothetical protein
MALFSECRQWCARKAQGSLRGASSDTRRKRQALVTADSSISSAMLSLREPFLRLAAVMVEMVAAFDCPQTAPFSATKVPLTPGSTLTAANRHRVPSVTVMPTLVAIA